MLSDEIREHHRHGVGGKASPGTGHVAEAGNEQHVDGDEHHRADAREIGSPDGAVGELIPEREVEEHPEHDFGRHHDGHHAQSFPVALTDDELQQVEIAHHGEEGQQGEDDVELHALCIGVFAVAVFRFAKHQRFVGISESLRNHHHDHGNLDARPIDAQLCPGLHRRTIVEIREQNLRCRLVELSCHAHDEQRPGVAEHAPAGSKVETKPETAQFLGEQQKRKKRAHQVDVEHKSHIEREGLVVDAEGVPAQGGQHDEVEQVQRDVEQNVHNPQRGKSHRLMLIAQVGKGNGSESIYGHRHIHHPHILRVVGIADGSGNGLQKQKHHHNGQHRRGGQHAQCGGIDALRVFTLSVHEPEEGGFHAEGEQDDEY